MVIRAIMFLGLRMARRNHFHLFAWLCAIAVPVGLQLMCYLFDDLRFRVLAGYFGVISLYMFFALTFGFGSVFASYYIIAYYRRREALDALVISRTRPWQLLAGAYAAIESVLVPPALGFSLGIVAFGLLAPAEMVGSSLQGWELLGLLYIVLMNQAILAATVSLGLMGRVDVFALLAMFMMLVLNGLPVILVFVHGWPVAAYAALLAGLLVLMLVIAHIFLSQRWPPHAEK